MFTVLLIHILCPGPKKTTKQQFCNCPTCLPIILQVPYFLFALLFQQFPLLIKDFLGNVSPCPFYFRQVSQPKLISSEFQGHLCHFYYPWIWVQNVSQPSQAAIINKWSNHCSINHHHWLCHPPSQKISEEDICCFFTLASEKLVLETCKFLTHSGVWCRFWFSVLFHIQILCLLFCLWKLWSPSHWLILSTALWRGSTFCFQAALKRGWPLHQDNERPCSFPSLLNIPLTKMLKRIRIITLPWGYRSSPQVPQIAHFQLTCIDPVKEIQHEYWEFSE